MTSGTRRLRRARRSTGQRVVSTSSRTAVTDATTRKTIVSAVRTPGEVMDTDPSATSGEHHRERADDLHSRVEPLEVAGLTCELLERQVALDRLREAREAPLEEAA